MKISKKRLIWGFIQIIIPLILLAGLQILQSITQNKVPFEAYLILFLLTLLGALMVISYLWRTRKDNEKNPSK